MTLLDGALLFLIVAVAGWEASPFSAKSRVLRASLLVFLAVLQAIVEGFTWQFVPGYLVILAACVVAGTKSPPRQHRGLFVRVGWAGGLVAAVLPWTLFLAVPQLTPPEGPYPVGTKVYRWVDASRKEEATPRTDDRRNVIVQAWYPAVPSVSGGRQPYLDLDKSGGAVGILPGFLLGRYDQTETHARIGIPLSTDSPSWPVLIFLTGYGGVRGVYTSLVAGLASWGFVVLAVDHPYEAAQVELADGTLARTVENFEPGDPDRTAFMEGRLALRVADVRFVLDQLGRPGVLDSGWEGRINLGRIGILGHSLGGAAGALAMAADHRIVGAVNLDGTLYGPIPGQPVRRPFLVVESDRVVTHHSDRYRAGNQALATFFGGDLREFEFQGSSHYSFTDVELFLGPLGQILWSVAVESSRSPGEIHRTTVRMVRDFFTGPALDASYERFSATKDIGDASESLHRPTFPRSPSRRPTPSPGSS